MTTYWLNQTSISKTKPETIKYNHSVCLKDDKTILELYSSEVVTKIKTKRKYNVDYYIPLLKSALQKAIRRKEVKIALSITDTENGLYGLYPFST